MRIVSVILLFVCVFAATFSKWCIITAFQINQQYISKTLCVNKENPMSHCDGHCYLSKQLNKEEKPTSPFTTSGSEKFEIQLFCAVLNTEHNLLSKQIKKYISPAQHFSAQQYSRDNFRPPKA